MELQIAFYIVGLVFMGLMLLIMLATVIAVFIIKAKLNALQRTVEEKVHLVSDKVHTVTNAVQTAGEILGAAKQAVGGRKKK